ncbi:hypothetical protein [Actinomycetospora sp. CA-084318]|uniref:hypothetical protein n=1 Tax=Actinomycetospora sp. CA-084318 TaxID=3239892 RepID=UPI003D956C7A
MADQQSWHETWMASFGRHLATQLTPLLPAEHELVAMGRELSLIVRRDGAPLRIAVSYELPMPAPGAVLTAAAAEQLLGEVQDEVAQFLTRTWPGDRGLHPRADDADGAIAMRFSARDGSGAIELAPFVPPSTADAVAAG